MTRLGVIVASIFLVGFGTDLIYGSPIVGGHLKQSIEEQQTKLIYVERNYQKYLGLNHQQAGMFLDCVGMIFSAIVLHATTPQKIKEYKDEL